MNWAVSSALFLGIVVLYFFWKFEKNKISAKEISLIATMAALAAVSRVPFAIIMSVQPTTFLVMISGYVLGAQNGFIIGASAAFVSNLFLGQGPWTPWQMFAWGLSGLTAGLVGHKKESLPLYFFAAFAFAWGYVFGWIMNIWHWLGFVYPNNLKTFLATYIASFPFDSMHAIGNLFFVLLFGQTTFKALTRYKKKISFERTPYEKIN